MAGSAGSIDGCGGRPARTWVSTNVTLANFDVDDHVVGPGPDLVHRGGLEHVGRPELPYHYRAHDVPPSGLLAGLLTELLIAYRNNPLR